MDKFRWESMEFGWFLALVPLVLMIFAWGANKRRRYLGALAGGRMMLQMLPDPRFSLRSTKNVLVCLAVLFAALALMRPQYDYTWETIEQKGIDVLIALDISRSMYAEDIAPSRFERSILEIKNLVNHLRGDRIGLILFTTSAVTQCPLTLDYTTFKSFLDEISPGSITAGGTSLAAAINHAAVSFDPQYRKERVLVLISDGESHTGDLEAAIDRASKAGIKIYSVGLGSPEGVPITVPGKSNGREYIKDSDGNIVLSRLKEAGLKKAALHTGGAYIQAGTGGFHLEKLYRQFIVPIEGRKMEMNRRREYEHRFYIPLAIAVLFLCLESGLPEFRSKAHSRTGNEYR